MVSRGRARYGAGEPITSSAAPPMVRASRAARSASASISSSAETFTTTAVDFIVRSSRRPSSPAVALVSGRVRKTQSDAARSACRLTWRAPASVFLLRLQNSTRIPKPWASRAMWPPMSPSPMIPAVLPASSVRLAAGRPPALLGCPGRLGVGGRDRALLGILARGGLVVLGGRGRREAGHRAWRCRSIRLGGSCSPRRPGLVLALSGAGGKDVHMAVGGLAAGGKLGQHPKQLGAVRQASERVEGSQPGHRLAVGEAAWGQQDPRAGRKVQDGGGGAVDAVVLVGVGLGEKLEAAVAGVQDRADRAVLVGQPRKDRLGGEGGVQLDDVEGDPGGHGDACVGVGGPPAADVGQVPGAGVVVEPAGWVQGWGGAVWAAAGSAGGRVVGVVSLVEAGDLVGQDGDAVVGVADGSVQRRQPGGRLGHVGLLYAEWPCGGVGPVGWPWRTRVGSASLSSSASRRSQGRSASRAKSCCSDRL